MRDDLNRLDSEVAAGHITAEEFRARRDHLLAAAGSGPATTGTFPAAHRRPAEANVDDAHTRVVPRAAPPAEERTQVVSRNRMPAGDRAQVAPRHAGPRAAPAEERTQVVLRTPPRPPQQPPPQRSAPADPERTQVMRAGTRPSGYSTVGAPPWARGSAAAHPGGGQPGFQRPEGTLPPWTLGPPAPTDQRPRGYTASTDFLAAPARRWPIPLAAAVVILVMIGTCLYFVL
ncbi:MAG: hypothetical protein ACXVXQ_10335 [Mycobacteriaceae bacterium]